MDFWGVGIEPISLSFALHIWCDESVSRCCVKLWGGVGQIEKHPVLLSATGWIIGIKTEFHKTAILGHPQFVKTTSSKIESNGSMFPLLAAVAVQHPESRVVRAKCQATIG